MQHVVVADSHEDGCAEDAQASVGQHGAKVCRGNHVVQVICLHSNVANTAVAAVLVVVRRYDTGAGCARTLPLLHNFDNGLGLRRVRWRRDGHAALDDTIAAGCLGGCLLVNLLSRQEDDRW